MVTPSLLKTEPVSVSRTLIQCILLFWVPIIFNLFITGMQPTYIDDGKNKHSIFWAPWAVQAKKQNTYSSKKTGFYHYGNETAIQR